MHIPKPVALALLATLAHAAPAPSQEEKQLSAREKMDKRIFGVVEAGLFLLNMVFAGLQFMDSPPPPWDPESGNCVIEVRSTHGGNCVAGASPGGEPAFTDRGDWNVCFLDGEQYLSFPDAPGRANVGDVMIKYTAAGGITPGAGDGLRNPMLHLLNLNPPVFIDMHKEATTKFDRATGGYDNICTEGDSGDGAGTYWYRCGVPCRDAVGDFTRNDI
ncbi:hypothetical protein BS50DRAFT_631459 [Corynespora cassiicola Philippines]|uniref:Cell wall protein PhiA n=1 Tax=Corynespora cassiicola Philippines TaxID=1448308 RepID=A0A2T2P1G1_CORCC|nr:hypothetical protein BS50DRAFT_631459 [Corynespora cassiicola Philippines]